MPQSRLWTQCHALCIIIIHNHKEYKWLSPPRDCKALWWTGAVGHSWYQQGYNGGSLYVSQHQALQFINNYEEFSLIPCIRICRKCPKLTFFDVSFCSRINEQVVKDLNQLFPKVCFKRSFNWLCRFFFLSKIIFWTYFSRHYN